MENKWDLMNYLDSGKEKKWGPPAFGSQPYLGSTSILLECLLNDSFVLRFCWGYGRKLDDNEKCLG